MKKSKIDQLIMVVRNMQIAVIVYKCLPFTDVHPTLNEIDTVLCNLIDYLNSDKVKKKKCDEYFMQIENIIKNHEKEL